jgi:hypothetical protein
MGFWDFMNRMFDGKPIFDRRDFRDEDGKRIPVDDADIYPQSKKFSPRPSNELPVDEHGQEVYPTLQIIQSGVHESGEEYLDLWVTIKNASDRTIELESTDIIGQSTRCTHRFTPGQQRQIEVYKGAVPNNDYYKYATLYFKELSSGHYFNSVHQILYHIEHSTRYLPQNFKYLRAFKNT